MKRGFKIGKDALIFSIMTLITVLTWVAYAVYQAATTSQITNVTKEQLTTLSPKIETEVFDEIEKGISFTKEELRTIRPPATESAILQE